MQVTISDKNLVTVKGPKGTLEQAVDPAITLKQEGGELTFERPSDAEAASLQARSVPFAGRQHGERV